MTTTSSNGNGKRKTNGNSKTYAGLTEPAQTTEQLEQMLNEKAAVGQPEQKKHEFSFSGSEETKATVGQPEGDIKNMVKDAGSTPKPQQSSTDTTAASPGADEKAAASGQPKENNSSKDSSNTTDGTASSVEQPQTTAEELLRLAKAATKEPIPQPQEGEEKGEREIASQTSTSQIVQATGEAAQDLVSTAEQAKQARIEMGARKALEDAQDIRQGYQVTLLMELAKNELYGVWLDGRSHNLAG